MCLDTIRSKALVIAQFRARGAWFRAPNWILGAMGATLGCSASGNESDSSRGTTAPDTGTGATGGLAQDSATSGTSTGGSAQSPGSGGGDTPASGGGAGGDNSSIAGHGGAGGASVTPGPGGAAGDSGAVRLALEGQPCAGYTLLGIPENDAGADFTAMLIDMDGSTVHRWTITGFPPKMLPGGSLMGCVGVTSGSYDFRRARRISS